MSDLYQPIKLTYARRFEFDNASQETQHDLANHLFIPKNFQMRRRKHLFLMEIS